MKKDRFEGARKPREFTSILVLKIETMQGLVVATENFMDSYRAVVSASAFRLNLS